MSRHGGVIRETATGQIVRHLVESPALTNNLMTLAANPALGAAKVAVDVGGHGMTIHKLNQVKQMLTPLLGLSQIAAGASVLNVGISAVGFAYMGYKLNQIQTSLGKIQQSMEAGFRNIDERLDVLSGQLAYLHLLVQENRQGQIHLAEAINQLHRTILIKEIAELQAELIAKARFPDTSVQPALKMASKVRMVMSDQVLQIAPDLEPQKMLLADVATQGWAVATATEVNSLLEIGMYDDARELLSLEVPKLKQNAEQWTNELLIDERPELNTAYRFTAPVFKHHVTQERVARIVNFSSSDRNLSPDKKQEKQDDIAVEFQMSYASQFDKNWIYQQVAIAEYLDTFGELSARLESLQDFAILCQKAGVKSSLELLPSNPDDGDWHTLCLN